MAAEECAPAVAGGPWSGGVGRPVVIGTRRSQLALAQTALVRAALEAAHPGLRVEVELITTRGDLILDRPLSAVGGKGLFVAEIEQALRDGVIDLAVHSAKDLPSDLPPDMALAAFPPRDDPRDALVSAGGRRLDDLPPGAVIGTSSLRRACQIRALRPDLRVETLRGNVDTRLRKLREGGYDAIVLAAAGLARLGLGDVVTELLAPARMLPAATQGILAIECRADDTATAALLAPLDDAAARTAALAERGFLARIGGGCHAPLAAYARIDGGDLLVEGLIGAADGRLVRGVRRGPTDAPAALGAALAEELLDAGGAALLEEDGGG